MSKIRREMSVLALIVTVAVSFVGVVTYSHNQAVSACLAKGPAKCKVSAIRAW